MTSNRPLEDWGKLIGDVPAATAILDRLLSRSADPRDHRQELSTAGQARVEQATTRGTERLIGCSGSTEGGRPFAPLPFASTAASGDGRCDGDGGRGSRVRSGKIVKTGHKRPPAQAAADIPHQDHITTDDRLHITPTATITQACLPTRSPVGFEAPIGGRLSSAQ